MVIIHREKGGRWRCLLGGISLQPHIRKFPVPVIVTYRGSRDTRMNTITVHVRGVRRGVHGRRSHRYTNTKCQRPFRGVESIAGLGSGGLDRRGALVRNPVPPTHNRRPHSIHRASQKFVGHCMISPLLKNYKSNFLQPTTTGMKTTPHNRLTLTAP